MGDARRLAIRNADEALLAQLGYKQEFRREFTPLEVHDLCYHVFPRSFSHRDIVQVFGIAFTIVGLVPSIASVLFYSIPNGGGPAMVWGVSQAHGTSEYEAHGTAVVSGEFIHPDCRSVDGRAWICSTNIWRSTPPLMCVILCIHHSSPSQSSISGPIRMHQANGETFSLGSLDVRNANQIFFIYNFNSADANTVGSIAAFASIDWGAALQVMTAVTIGTNNAIHETKGRLLYEMCFHGLSENLPVTYLQWYICGHRYHPHRCMLPCNTASCTIAKYLHRI